MAKISKCPVCGGTPTSTTLEYTSGAKSHSFSCSKLGAHPPIRSGARRTKREAAAAWTSICKDVKASNPSSPVNPVEKKGEVANG